MPVNMIIETRAPDFLAFKHVIVPSLDAKHFGRCFSIDTSHTAVNSNILYVD